MSVKKWDPIDAEAAKEETMEIDNQVAETINELNKKGFCFWQFNTLDNTVVCIVRNVGDKVPHGYPVYAFSELEMLLDVNHWTQSMILEAKKCAGVVITKVVTENNPGGAI